MPDDDAPTPPFDALVLAGGAGRRLGGGKPQVQVAGRALVDHALAAVAGALHRVLVGPADLARPGVPTTLEDPPLGGPVAGIAAGVAALQALDDPAAVVVVLACDVPRAGAVVASLVRAVAGADGARLVDADGRPQHLVAAYSAPALAAALVALGDPRGAPVRRLVEHLDLRDVPDPGGAADDADTWDQVRRLDAELRGTIKPTEGSPA